MNTNIPNDINGQPCRHNGWYRLTYAAGQMWMDALFRDDCDHGPVFVEYPSGSPWRVGRDVIIEPIERPL